MASLWDDFLDMVPGGGQGLSTYLNVGANLIAGSQAQQGERANQQIIQNQVGQDQAQMAAARTASAPGVSYLRGVLGTPAGQLTPAQQQGLQIAQKTAKTQLATSGLRGAGQAQLDVMRNLDNSYVGNAVQSNIARQDTAGNELAQPNLASYGKTAFPDVIGASSAGRAAASGAMFPAGALTSSASTIGRGMGAQSPLADVGGLATTGVSGAPAGGVSSLPPASTFGTGSPTSPASGIALTGIPGSSSSFDQITSTIGATNKGAARYPGQGGQQSTTADGNTLNFAE